MLFVPNTQCPIAVYAICYSPISIFYPNQIKLTSSDPVTESPNQLQSNRQDEENKKLPRKCWTKEQDNKILQIIKKMNLPKNKKIPYRIIARSFQGRTSKQIRERYLNTLDESINKEPFDENEDNRIYSFYLENGPKWKKLSQIMKGRTPTSIKNRFNTKVKQRFLTKPEDEKDIKSDTVLSSGSELLEIQ